MTIDHSNLKLLILVAILQVLRFDLKKLRIMEVLNFHPCSHNVDLYSISHRPLTAGFIYETLIPCIVPGFFATSKFSCKVAHLMAALQYLVQFCCCFLFTTQNKIIFAISLFS